MDPKKLAEEILEQLFPQNEEELFEEKDEDEDEGEEDEGEYEGEEEEGPEHEENEPAGHEAAEAKGGNSSKNQASVAMKPSMASPAVNAGPNNASGNSVQDAHGGTPTPVNGKPAFQTLTVTNVNAAANAATLNMKPSFAGVELPSLNRGQMQEEVKTLFGADVSEEFVDKAVSLYEASINTNLQTITEQMSVLFEEKLAESVVQIAEELESNVSDYLGYVVQEWIKENELAVDNGLRTEIAESFIEGLKNLFAESYIEMPEDKTNIFDEMTTAIENLETRVNEELEKNISLNEQVSLLEAQAVFTEETKTLKTIDAENLRKLAENVEFSDVEDFRSKVKLLVENYSKVKSAPAKNTTANTENTKNVGAVIDTLMEETDNAPQVEFINENIKLYSEVLGRTIQG
jgi:hypothetical protein